MAVWKVVIFSGLTTLFVLMGICIELVAFLPNSAHGENYQQGFCYVEKSEIQPGSGGWRALFKVNGTIIQHAANNTEEHFLNRKTAVAGKFPEAGWQDNRETAMEVRNNFEIGTNYSCYIPFPTAPWPSPPNENDNLIYLEVDQNDVKALKKIHTDLWISGLVIISLGALSGAALTYFVWEDDREWHAWKMKILETEF